jgi:hypothetical protein
MDRGNNKPADINSSYMLNDLANAGNLNTFYNFGKKKSGIASNALVLPTTNDGNMYMLLPQEMRNDIHYINRKIEIFCERI